MDQRVRDYLIRAHNKVIAHYQELLRTSSLAASERQRIQQRLALIEVERDRFRMDDVGFSEVR
jgi:hypothetical protein